MEALSWPLWGLAAHRTVQTLPLMLAEKSSASSPPSVHVYELPGSVAEWPYTFRNLTAGQNTIMVELTVYDKRDQRNLEPTRVFSEKNISNADRAKVSSARPTPTMHAVPPLRVMSKA